MFCVISAGRYSSLATATPFKKFGFEAVDDDPAYPFKLDGFDGEPRWAQIPPRVTDTFNSEYAWHTRIAYGWPFRSIYGGYTIDTGPDGNSRLGSDIRWEWALPIDTSTDGEFRFIPLRPIWPGLLANTAVFAAFIYLLIGPTRWYALHPLRRALRERRRHCAVCNYPRGEPYTHCPECGHTRGNPLHPNDRSPSSQVRPRAHEAEST